MSSDVSGREVEDGRKWGQLVPVLWQSGVHWGGRQKGWMGVSKRTNGRPGNQIHADAGRRTRRPPRVGRSVCLVFVARPPLVLNGRSSALRVSESPFRRRANIGTPSNCRTFAAACYLFAVRPLASPLDCPPA